MIRVIVALAALLGLALAAHAQSGPAQDSLYGAPAEARWAPFFGVMPGCDDNGVLSTISSRFGQIQSMYWGDERAIQGFEKVREIGFRSNGLAYIPRRYCVARVVMADPPQAPPEYWKKRTVVYSIASDTNVFGWDRTISWCVVGLDPNHAFAPDCETLRPILERWIGEYKPFASIYGLKARY